MLVQQPPIPIERRENQNKFHLRCMWIATRLSYTNALSIGKGAIHYVNWVCCQDENPKQNYSSLFSSSVGFVRLTPNSEQLFDSRSISAIFWLLLQFVFFSVICSSLFCCVCLVSVAMRWFKVSINKFKKMFLWLKCKVHHRITTIG